MSGDCQFFTRIKFDVQDIRFLGSEVESRSSSGVFDYIMFYYMDGYDSITDFVLDAPFQHTVTNG